MFAQYQHPSINSWSSFLPPDEDYGREKETTKKIRAPPREIKHKKSKNSQEERQESTFLHFKLLNMWQMVRTSEFHDWFRMCSDLWGM